MLIIYKYVFAQGVFILIFMTVIYYFSRFLTEFFEYRPIPACWAFLLMGISFYLAANSLLFIPFLYAAAPVKNYWLFYSIVQPIGALIAAYCAYNVEEDARNV